MPAFACHCTSASVGNSCSRAGLLEDLGAANIAIALRQALSKYLPNRPEDLRLARVGRRRF
jgi:FPC/CPF motif-containing protein YcgG